MQNIFQSLFSPTNEFFQLAKDSKRLTHIAFSSFLLPIVFLATAGILSQFVFSPLFFSYITDPPTWSRDVFILLVLFGTGVILIFLWVKFFEGRKISTLGFTKTGAVKKYLSGFGVGILMNSAVIGIMALWGTIEVAEGSKNITGIDAISIVVLFLFGFMVQGASEEILSRGWMMQVIGARYKPWLGVVISTIFFAILHLGNSGVNFISVINLLLVAVLLAFFVLNEGSLWFACAWHSSWNWLMGNVYGLSVSGQGEKVSLFDLNTIGTKLISGGGFGPEGSIITSFVILIGIIVLSIKIMNKNNSKKEENGTTSFNQS